MRVPLLLSGLTVLVGCQTSFLGFSGYDTGPLRTDSFTVEGAKARRAHVDLEFGVGRLVVKPGERNEVVRVESSSNVYELQPVFEERGTERDLALLIHPREREVSFPWFGRDEIENDWDLRLAPDLPFDLDVGIGVGEAQVELGGLWVSSIELDVGAAEVELGWSMPNLDVMSSFRVDAGAARVELRGLGNADFETMHFSGGVGEFIFDLSGEWRRPATLHMDCGLGELRIEVPRDLPVRIDTSDVTLSEIDADGFRRIRGARVNEACHEEGEPWVSIYVSLGLGELSIVEVD